MAALREDAGQLVDGARVEAVTLTNRHGVSARILTYGATLQSLIAPDRAGALADIVLGHDDVAGYEATRAFMGVTVGRYANRIAGGRFALDGVAYRIAPNEGAHVLHGGETGFDRVVWGITAVTDDAVTLTHVSPDGAGGFPGELTARVTYRLDDDGDLTIAFAATTTRPTIVNLTNHALFNLTGAAGEAMQHRLTIAASAYTPINAQAIPTGELRKVEGSVFDFRKGRIVAVGLRDGTEPQIVLARGYDHNFALDKGVTVEPQLAAVLDDPASGRRVTVLTTEPGIQLYTGNAYDGSLLGKQGQLYRMGEGIALEPQTFPDTPNRPEFGSARLDPGQTYRHTMIYRLSTYDEAPFSVT